MLMSSPAPARADELLLHAPHYQWDHTGPFSSFDAARCAPPLASQVDTCQQSALTLPPPPPPPSTLCGGRSPAAWPPPPPPPPRSPHPPPSLRRGHQVYASVCASCHSINRLCFRNLVNVMYSEDEVKKMAAEIDVEDGPDDAGEMFERPGKLSDAIPSPYKNVEQGRMANGGAYPPDLSLMIKARHGGEDYVFALLTGYKEPPEGVKVGAGLHYNPYFAGSKIAMGKQLNDGGVEYADGTPASAAQMGKDVTQFLAWVAEPNQDERKLAGLKWVPAIFAACLMAGWYKRFRWSTLKSRKISYTD
jgi:ubiquinol-cytochrome c reductase cytochrome c1 subunit